MERDRKDDGGVSVEREDEGRRGGGEGWGGRPGMKCDKGCELDSNLQCRV